MPVHPGTSANETGTERWAPRSWPPPPKAFLRNPLLQAGHEGAAPTTWHRAGSRLGVAKGRPTCPQSQSTTHEFLRYHRTSSGKVWPQDPWKTGRGWQQDTPYEPELPSQPTARPGLQEQESLVASRHTQEFCCEAPSSSNPTSGDPLSPQQHPLPEAGGPLLCN